MRIAVVVALLGLALTARAGEPPVPEAYRLFQQRAIRASGEVSWVVSRVPQAGNPGEVAVGTTVSLSRDDRLSWDTSASDGLGPHPSARFASLVRWALLLDHSRVHALSLGAGPDFLIYGDYGPVLLAQLELAYQLRLPAGLDLLVGAGPGLSVTSSRTASVNPGGYHAGDLVPHVKLELGWAF